MCGENKIDLPRGDVPVHGSFFGQRPLAEITAEESPTTPAGPLRSWICNVQLPWNRLVRLARSASSRFEQLLEDYKNRWRAGTQEQV
jgi:hypothetical protein